MKGAALGATELVGIDLVLFEIAGSCYAADLTQVRRIDVDDPTESVGAPFGKPVVGRRALVFGGSGGLDLRLAVDKVMGVERVPFEALRRMPPAAQAPKATIGAWLRGDQTVLLIDLSTLNPFTTSSLEQA